MTWPTLAQPSLHPSRWFSELQLKGNGNQAQTILLLVLRKGCDIVHFGIVHFDIVHLLSFLSVLLGLTYVLRLYHINVCNDCVTCIDHITRII